MQKARIRQKGLATLFHWIGPKIERNCFFLTGIPTTTEPVSVTEFLCDLGFGVFQPQYHGAFDSDGEFSPQGCIETVFNLSTQLNAGNVYDLRGHRNIKIPTTVQLVCGHSFGTYVAVGALVRGFSPKVAVLFAPMFEFGAKATDVGLLVNLDEHVDHIAEALPLTFRMSSREEWRNFFVKREKFHPSPTELNNLLDREKTKIYVIVGDQDPSLNVKTAQVYTEKFCKEYSNTLDLVDFDIVPGGGHGLEDLLTNTVKSKIRSLIE